MLRWEGIEMERYADECDVCIVGGGPAGGPGKLWNFCGTRKIIQIVLTGMSTAIRLKQLANEAGDEVSVGLLIIIWSLFYLLCPF